MQRGLLLTTLITLVSLSTPASLQAQVEVHIKGKTKPISGTVQQDSVLGLRLKGAELIPAEQIEDVLHTVELTSVQILLRSASLAEKNVAKSVTSEDRMKALGDAAKKWEEALAKIPPTAYAARRQAEFKIAFLNAQQAREKGTQASQFLATAGLEKFLKANPDCWQYATAMVTLANLQASAGDFDKAEDTFKKIADNPKLSQGTKNEAVFQVVRMNMNAKKYPAAQQKIKELIANLPKDSPYLLKVQLADAECSALGGNVKAASDMLKKLLQETKDKDVRAVAHNTLGYCYLQNKDLQEARWEFLWVDVVYNQNKAEHARALYHLSHVFRELKDQDRAEECRQTLLSSAFNGTEYQRRAIAEGK